MLALVTGVLVLAIVTYMVLAISLIRSDHLAYVFDLNRSTAQKLAAQVDATFQGLVARLTILGDTVATEPALRRRLIQSVLRADRDLLRVTLYEVSPDNRFVAVENHVARERLIRFGLNEENLLQLDETDPLPVVRASGQLLVVNRSLPPSAPLISVMITQSGGGPTPQWAVTADLAHEQLLNVFATNLVYNAYLVGIDGVVVAHPERDQVTRRASLAQVPVVAAALAAPSGQGSVEFESDDGFWIGAYAPVARGRLRVITEIRRERALAASSRLVGFSVQVGLAIFLVAFVLSLVFARRLTVPLQSLRQATHRLAQGRYELTLPAEPGDEIGELAEDFRRMAKDLKNTQKQLLESGKLAAVGQLGAGISHEVKNPLGTIRGFAELALMSLDNRKQVEESLRMIIQGATRSLEIVKNFLSFTRPTQGERNVADLADVVSEALRLVDHQLRIGRVRLHTSFASPLPVSVDAKQIQQVILNLALNAGQAMASGGNIYVVTQAREERWAELEFRDDGPGMPADVRERIFEPFFTTKQDSEGTGLGLSISYRIIQEHGGEIEVDSEVGHGCTFRIRLPLCPNPQEAPKPTKKVAQRRPTRDTEQRRTASPPA